LLSAEYNLTDHSLKGKAILEGAKAAAEEYRRIFPYS
jgi:hypothetical protein